MEGLNALLRNILSRYRNPVMSECHDRSWFWKDTKLVSIEDLLEKQARNSREANLIKSYDQRSGVLRAERLVVAAEWRR